MSWQSGDSAYLCPGIVCALLAVGLGWALAGWTIRRRR